MTSIFDDLKRQFQSGDLLTKVLFVNIGLYVIILMVNIFATLFIGSENNEIVSQYIFPFLSLNTNLIELLIHPWTLITHQFVHALDPWHLIGNMFLLYFLGRLFLNYFSPKQLFGLYLLGGLVGALSLIITVNLSPYFSNNVSAIGASASVMAIAIAVCSYSPKTTVFLFGIFKVPLQYVGLFLIISDILFFYDGNTGGHIAHIGGAITGFWFAKNIKQGKDITSKVNQVIDGVNKIIPALTRKKQKLTVEHSNVKNMSDEDYNYLQHISQEQVDEILDKIGKSGYESLSKKEKDILFKFSKKNN